MLPYKLSPPRLLNWAISLCISFLYRSSYFISSFKYRWWMMNGAWSVNLPSPDVVAFYIHLNVSASIFYIITLTFCVCMSVSERHTYTHWGGGDRQCKKALHISWNAIWWVVKWDFASALHKWSHCWPVASDLTLHLHAHTGWGFLMYTHSALWCTSFIFLAASLSCSKYFHWRSVNYWLLIIERGRKLFFLLWRGSSPQNTYFSSCLWCSLLV